MATRHVVLGPTRTLDSPERRWLLRRVGAALAASMAAVYLLIAAGVVTVGESRSGSDQGEMDMVTFGVGAATIFLVGAALLLLVDRRVLWMVGSLLQLLVIGMYLAVSVDREPAFELWGVGLRVVQVALLGVLVVLAATAPVERADDRTT